MNNIPLYSKIYGLLTSNAHNKVASTVVKWAVGTKVGYSNKLTFSKPLSHLQIRLQTQMGKYIWFVRNNKDATNY